MPSTTVTVTNATELTTAVQQATSGETINIAPSLSGPIAVSNTLAFASGLTGVSVVGVGNSPVTIQGNGTSSVFSFATGDNITLSNLEITGGGGSTGAGIDNASGGTLTIVNCLIDHNTATTGAGIDNAGILAITNCTVENNTANAASVLGLLGINGGGGGILNESTGVLTGNSSTLANNTVANGLISLGAVSGGGLENFGGSVKLTNCTIADNSITSGVSVVTASGAGLENADNGTVTLVNCTVADNTITALASVIGSGGGIDNSSGSLNLINTIVINPSGATTGPDVNGTITNAVNSIFASDTQTQIVNSLLGGTLLGDLFNGSGGLLGTLGLNGGGTTPTVPLLGSILTNPAIGGGISLNNIPSDVQSLLTSLGVSLPTVDQNGLDRALGFIDIGSFQSLLPTVTTVVGTPQNGLSQLVATITGPDGVLNTLTNGAVTFLDNGQLLGKANVVDGVATLLTDLLASGNNLITALFGGVDGILNLGGSTSPPITVIINPPGGGSGGGGSGGGGSGSGGTSGGGTSGAKGGFVVPPPLDAAVRAANQATFQGEGIVLGLQPFLSNPAVLQAVLNGLTDALANNSDPNVGLLLFEEYQLFSSLSSYIKAPDNYAPNAPPTNALANQVQSEAGQIRSNSALLSSYPAAVLGGTIELYLLAGSGSNVAGPEAALSQLAPSLL